MNEQSANQGRSEALSRARLDAALNRVLNDLMAEQNPAGRWTGELSSSALSTATAVIALAVFQRSESLAPEPQRASGIANQASGLRWLADHINPDGGWGDTTQSLSNISTTALCWAAFGAVPGADAAFGETVARAEAWLGSHLESSSPTPEPAGPADPARSAAGSRLSPSALAAAILRRYGRDRTFSAPILTACALSGRLGSGAEAWRDVLPLPFELAACPHQWFAALRLPVVSYALPALIAIGLARHVHRPSPNPIARGIRHLARGRVLRVLTRIQPGSGGFLEATPLTSFVLMSLAGIGQGAHPVSLKAAEFLLKSQREDGGWPIDTNLATWVTTLALNALATHSTPSLQHPSQSPNLPPPPDCLSWLLAQQGRIEHPYTHSPPGGWAWTDLPGGVPDADDTAGALLALRHFYRKQAAPANSPSVHQAATAGITWLLNLQNRDGGIPTFCRGWGALPFDRSSADLTAHALRAWLAWREEMPPPLRRRVERAIPRALRFLERTQRSDGSWVPLWFGNQSSPNDENPAYGTSRVVLALCAARRLDLARIFHDGRVGSPLPAAGCQPALAFCHARRAEDCAPYHGSLRAFPAAPEISRLGVPAMLGKGVDWLVHTRNADGGWGGNAGIASSVEETGLAVEALAEFVAGEAAGTQPSPAALAVEAGTAWLVARVESGEWKQPSPIGFYFAKLWYFERLYPRIFTAAALGRAQKQVPRREG